ncbi:uncharacterized protein Dwil_GK16687 [Drosophila willistoni]|uniref:Uncharacterized protein n=1 Tax=Drosophila willistoni TaxID=7260 RepID=B4MLB7_DROWI|nr:uncharacterized protein LOC6639018 [Drosophila willistoni]XP_046868173.1 uncharacterized protein LOC6639018 [Drosophila willistoni]EDW73375.1 uncharacterized protein Dwil_GK16687 [Drosophila willistoni]
MQKCSELTSNLEVWQSLSRYGLPALKVKKGPEGHQLVETCHDQLKKVLPADTYEKLMAWVTRWLKSLDEKDAKTRTKANEIKTLPELPLTALSRPKSGKDTAKKDSSVVDLCIEDDTQEIQTRNSADVIILGDNSYENSENGSKNKAVFTKEKDHVGADDQTSKLTTDGSPEYSVRATSKTYLTPKKPKVQKALIRVRTDLKAIVNSSIEESQKILRPLAPKRKLCPEQPKKPCDSTTEESCPKKHKLSKDLATLLQESIDEASPDTTSSTIANPSDPNPNPVLGLNHILGLLDCVESYATWQHNLDAIALLVQLRDCLQDSN